MNIEVNSGNAVLASNYSARIHGCHAGMKCDLKGKSTVCIVFRWPTESKYKSHLFPKEWPHFFHINAAFYVA